MDSLSGADEWKTRTQHFGHRYPSWQYYNMGDKLQNEHIKGINKLWFEDLKKHSQN